MKTNNNNAFKYAPKTFHYGTQKYIFYQFPDNSTLILPQIIQGESTNLLDFKSN